MREEFDLYLLKRRIKLTSLQETVAHLILDAIGYSPKINEFFTTRASGKTFLFKVLDGFFSERL